MKVFKVGSQKFIIGMIIKLFERSPLGSVFLRYASIFDPSVLFELERNLLTKRMKSLVKFMIELKTLWNLLDVTKLQASLIFYVIMIVNHF